MPASELLLRFTSPVVHCLLVLPSRPASLLDVMNVVLMEDAVNRAPPSTHTYIYALPPSSCSCIEKNACGPLAHHANPPGATRKSAERLVMNVLYSSDSFLFDGYTVQIPSYPLGQEEAQEELPSLHVWAIEDRFVPASQSQRLAGMYLRSSVFMHRGSHYVPQTKDVVPKFVRFLDGFR